MVWDVDPVLVSIGTLEIRYYGVLFATGIFLAFLCWRYRMLRLGYNKDTVEAFLVWSVIAVVVGARLGHCFFYEYEYYLKHPLDIFKIWQGGLASHGAAIACVIMIYIYHRVKQVALIDIMDSFAMPVAVVATFVRLGNFMNSEIVGRVTDMPWGLQFPRYEAYVAYLKGTSPEILTRHPSQLYEALMGVCIFTVLFWVDAKTKSAPRKGLLAALLLVLYFSGRFLVEYVKAYQSLDPSSPLTMGQILSIPFILWGIGMLIWVWRSQKQ